MADRGRGPSEQHDANDGFLRRWSRRKSEARYPAPSTEDSRGLAEGAPASLEQRPEPEKGAPAPIEPKEPSDPKAPSDPEALPDIESLGANSDFTVFMRPGVPEHLRTLALRKLWRSNPIFSKLDGMVEYGEDYSIATWPKGTIRTAYQVGRGFLEQIGEDAERDRALPAEATAQPADEPARVAAAPAEPLPEPASLQEPDAPLDPGSPPREPDAMSQEAAPRLAKRRRRPARS